MNGFAIIGGVNGVGKSSFTGVLKECIDLGVVVDVDKIAAELGNDLLTAAKTAIKIIRDCIDHSLPFAQETTLSGYKTVTTAKQVKALGYYIHLYYIGLDTVDESLQRIENRVRRGGHNIPTDDVVRRFDGRWNAVAKILPYCDEAEFYDNDNGFVKVAEFRNGELRLIRNQHPKWIKELAEYLTGVW